MNSTGTDRTQRLFEEAEKLGPITKEQIAIVTARPLVECEERGVPVEKLVAIVVELASKGQIDFSGVLNPRRETRRVGDLISLFLKTFPKERDVFDFLEECSHLGGEAIYQNYGPQVGLLLIQLLSGGPEALARLQECADRLEAI